MFISQRTLLIASGVVLLHAGALWALQAGLMRQPDEVIVPVEAISEILVPAAIPAPPAPPLRRPAPLPRPVAPPVQAAATPPDRPALTPPPPPLRAVPAGGSPAPSALDAPTPPAAAPSPAGPTGPAALVTGQVAAAPAPAPPKVEMPSSDADYLQNPKPAYPSASRRLGEQGKVLVRVLIGVDGTAQRAEIRQSSGFDRLDQAALQTVLKWRYVPGRREGKPEAMWFNVPINFVLE